MGTNRVHPSKLRELERETEPDVLARGRLPRAFFELFELLSRRRGFLREIGVELLKGIRSGVERLRERRRRVKKSSRNGVHIADAVVWGPVYRPARTSAFSAAGRTARTSSQPRPPSPPPPSRGRAASAPSSASSARGCEALSRRGRSLCARATRDSPRRRRRRGSSPSAWKTANVGVELKGVRSGVERRRGRVLKARDPGRRETPAGR
eukprot:30858-Pelagococcus_subviridis.AAC.9